MKISVLSRKVDVEGLELVLVENLRRWWNSYISFSAFDISRTLFSA
jgi:hypothetical protein